MTSDAQAADSADAQDLHGLSDRHGDLDVVAGDPDRSAMPRGRQVGLGILAGLGRVEDDLAGGAEQREVDGLGTGPGRGLGFVDGLDPGGEGEPAVDHEAGEEQQGEGEDDDEGRDHSLFVPGRLR